MQIPVIGGTAPAGTSIDPEVTRNFFPELHNKVPVYRHTPGLEYWINAGDGEVRAWVEHKGSLFLVVGREFVEVSKGGAATVRGVISTYSGPVVMDSSGYSIMVVEGGIGWYYKDGFHKIVDEDFPKNASDVEFMDGFWTVTQGDTGKWSVCENTYDPVNWNALDFTYAEARPDNLIRRINDKNIMWAFGERSIEAYVNTGNIDFPFEPIRQAMSHYGIEAFASLAPVDGRLFWLGNADDQGGRVVFGIAGSADPKKVSDHRLDQYMASLDKTEIAAAYAYGVMWQGHPWYVLTFPYSPESHGRTFVYDVSVGIWFEWASKSTHITGLGKFRGEVHIYFNGDNLVADNQGNLYKLKEGVFTDNGDVIIRERIMTVLDGGGKFLRFPEIQLDVQTGKGTPGTDYTMELSISRDGGHTFGNSRSRSIGEGGEYDHQVRWYQNGRGRRTTFRFSTSAQCPVTIRSGYIRAERG